MDAILKISDHPKFSSIKRQVELGPLTIDYKAKEANWPFHVVHTDSKGVELLEIPRASGNFKLSNVKLVDAATGVKLADDADEETVEAGVPEFDFLRAMLMQPQVDPLVLGNMRIAATDARGNFNDYSKLMLL